MFAKILKLNLIALSTLTFQACSSKQEVKYVDRPVTVKVPIKCVVQDAECDFNRTTYTSVVSSMMECIVNMKHNEEVCK
jgi:hypothetical protein